MIELKLWLHFFLCAIIFLRCFCHQQISTAQNTRADVRATFGALASASLWFGITPLAPSWWPGAQPYIATWPDLLMLSAIAAVQAGITHPWRPNGHANFQACRS
jgi:hypothetical protein